MVSNMYLLHMWTYPSCLQGIIDTGEGEGKILRRGEGENLEPCTIIGYSKITGAKQLLKSEHSFCADQ